ncbi:MAG: hypothetical protein NXI22_25510, partial [bacterium]|nr:hypothetical protein [bacterium]
LIANRWGGLVDAATRVEIQLRRAKLKTFGVDTLEDWFENRATICKRVMKDWCRLTDGPVDRNHANRAPLHPMWILAIEQFAAWCDGPDDLELTPLATATVDASRLVKCALGNLISVFARNGKVLKDNKQFLHEVKFQLLDAIGERDIAEEVRRRAFETGTS